jgi:hypothetical protein
MPRGKTLENQLKPPAAAPVTALAGDDLTHVIFILDRSGSMSGRRAT